MRVRIERLLTVLMIALIASVPMGTAVSAQDGAQADELRSQLSGLIDTSAADALLDVDTIDAIAASPVGPSIAYLVTEFITNPAVEPALNAVVAGLVELPPAYTEGNPWKAASSGQELLRLFVDEFLAWGTFLPQISGDMDNGLYYIERIAWLVYLNPAGQDWVQGRDPISGGTLETGAQFMQDFSDQRGEFMWSPESTAQIAEWVADPRIEIEDYQVTDPNDFASFNDFFARNISVDEANQTIPSRPATMPISEYPERDYIVVAPTDCVMNALVQVLVTEADVVRQEIDNPLQYNTMLDIKGIPIQLDRLLGSLDDDLKQQFVGGTGLSCVLMPNTYHHFHAPVNGTVVHAEVIEANTFGILDFANWAPTSGNVGRAGTDFSQYEVFERGVIVIEVKYQDVNGAELTGYVASVPVGLATIGSVVLDDDVKVGQEVTRGYTRLGNFYYGGSLNILLFSKGLATGAMQTRLGNQIAVFDVGSSPAVE